MHRIILLTMLVVPWVLVLAVLLGNSLVERISQRLKEEQPAKTRTGAKVQLPWRGREAVWIGRTTMSAHDGHNTLRVAAMR